MGGFGHVAAEHEHAAGLDLYGAGDAAQQRGFSHAVGADQSDHAAGRQFDRDVVKRRDTTVTLGDVFKESDEHLGTAYWATANCNQSGQWAAASVST